MIHSLCTVTYGNGEVAGKPLTSSEVQDIISDLTEFGYSVDMLTDGGLRIIDCDGGIVATVEHIFTLSL